MSENYSKKTYNERVDALCKVMYHTGYFSDEEADKYETEARTRAEAARNNVIDNLDLAFIMTGNKENEVARESGIVNAILGSVVQTTFLEPAWYMQRDDERSVNEQTLLTTQYEIFVNEQMHPMFGPEGYRKILSGNYEGFMKDFMKYGAKPEEIVDFELGLIDSVFNGIYAAKSAKLASELCYRVSKNRKESMKTERSFDPEGIPVTKDELQKVKEMLQEKLGIEKVEKTYSKDEFEKEKAEMYKKIGMEPPKTGPKL